MEVKEPGHVYSLRSFDGGAPVQLVFFKRIGRGYPGNLHPAHCGTNCQEVIRALIDRVKYLDGQIPCAENLQIISLLRSALISFELRAARRHGVELSIHDGAPEMWPTGADGHILEIHND